MFKILDCTLRDGGYYTNWDFSSEVVDSYIQAMNQLPIDYLEVGYRNNQSKEYLGKFGYSPISVLKHLRKTCTKKLVVMLNEKGTHPADMVHLLQPIIGLVDMVRIAIDPNNFDRALVLAQSVKSMGFEVGFNVMYMSKWGDYDDFYNERRKQLLAVKPNRGHKLVSEMEKFFNVTVITQNIDNLHERAGSSHIIHLHGELTKVTSSWQPNNPAYIKELKPEEYEIHLGDLAGDGSQFRPFIVWFGESVPMIETAIEYAETADIFLIIGTSLNVYPAAGLLNYVPARTPVYLIDPKQVPIASGRKVHVIQKGASEGMEELKKILVG